jgi:hypothetical protein
MVDILIANCETFTKNFHSLDRISIISATRRPCFCCSDAHSLSRQLVINSLHLVMPYHLCYELVHTNVLYLYVLGNLHYSLEVEGYILYMVFLRYVSGMHLK